MLRWKMEPCWHPNEVWNGCQLTKVDFQKYMENIMKNQRFLGPVGSKLVPKSHPKRTQKRCPKWSASWGRFWSDFIRFWRPSWTQKPSHKASKIHAKNHSKKYQFLDRVLSDFGSILGAKLWPCWRLFWPKRGDPVKCSCARCCIVVFFWILVCLDRVWNGFWGVRADFGTEICLFWAIQDGFGGSSCGVVAMRKFPSTGWWGCAEREEFV